MPPAAHVIELAAPPLPLRYTACGLTIASNRPIAGLAAMERPAEATADVGVSLRGGDVPIPPPDPADHIWYCSPDLDESGRPVLVAARRHGDYWLRYSEGAAFRIDETGRRVDTWWTPPLTEVDAATYLLGPVLAFVLRLRERVPLHASAANIDGRAVLLAGDAGAGKSTTAAVLATLGHPILSDDVVPITVPRHGRPMAWPGYPRLSLCGDAADALFAGGRLPAFSDTYQKRYLDLETMGLAFERASVPLGLVVVLGEHSGTEQIGVRPLGAREALMALVRHAYGSYLIDTRMRAYEFDLLGRVVSTVPLWEVRFGGRLEAITAQCAALVERLRERAHASQA